MLLNIKKGYFLLLLLTSNLVYASALTDFKQGAALFELGDYTNAATKFEHALSDGMKTTALYYNLASTYFKLNNFNKSRVYFKELQKLPEMKSLAEYNLGLIHEKLGDNKQANRYFKSVIKDNKDRKLVSLAKIKIYGKNPDLKKISTYTSIKIGYDDNINVSPTGTVIDEADSFTEYFVTADYLFSGNRKNGWISDVTLFRSSYTDSNIYDFDQIGLGLINNNKYNKLEIQLRTNYDKYTYGNEDYQSILKLESRAKYNITSTKKLQLRYRYEFISSDLAIYDYLNGWRQKLRTEYKQYNKDSILKFFYEYEINDRDDLVTTVPSGVLSYSPTRHNIKYSHTKIIDKHWRLTGDFSYRKSNYPTTITQNRDDERWKLTAYADYRLNRSTLIRSKLDYTDNNSTEAIYDYDRTVVSIDLSYFF